MGPLLSSEEQLLELIARVEPSTRGAKQVRAKRVRIAVLLRSGHGNDSATNSTVSFLTNENAKRALRKSAPASTASSEKDARLGPP